MHPKDRDTYVVIIAMLILITRPSLFLTLAGKFKRSIPKHQENATQSNLRGLGHGKRRRLNTEGNNDARDTIHNNLQDEDD